LTVVLVFAGMMLVSLATPSVAADLTEAEERGKYLYETGRSRGRRVINVDLGNDEPPIPGHVLPCINCHGADGRGAEDYVGVAPLNINWYALASSDVHIHAVRSHRPFDEATLARAIVFGLDPDNNKMEKAMPRYDMAREDVEDLIAYLKVMDSQSDPAISGSAVQIGTVIPTDGRHAGLGQAIRKTIQAVFDEVNASGGINSRQLELAVGGWTDDGNPEIWAARDLVNNSPVAALVSPYVPNYDEELEALANEKRLPVVGPYTVLQPNGIRDGAAEFEDNEFTFYLLAGLEVQARALVDAATARVTAEETRLAIVYPRVRFFDRLAEAASSQAEALGFASVTEEVFELNAFRADSVVVSLREDDPGAVLFLGNGAELAQFARHAAQADWQPLLLAPALLAQNNIFELPEAFNRRVLLAHASAPTDYSPEGAADFEQLHEKYGFDYSYSIAQVNAYIAARVLVEGLQRAGRDLTRQGLVEALESFDDFHPGLAPALSYGESRRIGSVGAHIVPVDLEQDRYTEPVRWIEPRATD
jgi:ABC-type branched-subunit amino acid transport system substrate-binding protein